MAGATETVDNSLAAMNLTGRSGNRQVGNLGGTRAQLQQPRAGQDDRDRSNDGQKKRRTRARPFQKPVLATPGANAEPGEQRRDNDLCHKIKCFKHHVSSSKDGPCNTLAITSKGVPLSISMKGKARWAPAGVFRS